jgi:hypothetical protein
MEESFIAHLLAASSVTAIVANRVFPFSRLQGSALPAVTVQRISGAPLYADDGEAGLLNARMQVDCWATTYATAKTLGRAVTDAFTAFSGTVNGTEFQFVTLENEQDMREPGANVAEYLYRVILDFEVWTTR